MKKPNKLKIPNVVINKKQLQSTLDIIKNQKESTTIRGDKNSGILFLKKNISFSDGTNYSDLNSLNATLRKIEPKDSPISPTMNVITFGWSEVFIRTLLIGIDILLLIVFENQPLTFLLI